MFNALLLIPKRNFFFADPPGGVGLTRRADSRCFSCCRAGNGILFPRQLNFLSLYPNRVLSRFDLGAVGIGINLSEFCAEEQNLRGIENPN